MNIYTIGFAQKSAEDFFGILEKNGIDCLLDVRLNNVSQLAGYTKSRDLKFFLKKILDIPYFHSDLLAPTKDILDSYKDKKISWTDYEIKYRQLMIDRGADRIFKDIISPKIEKACLLCSEPTPDNCHRRILAEYLKSRIDNISITHL